MNEADERLTQLQDLIAHGSRVVIGTREEVHEYVLTLMTLVPQVIADLKNARVPTETKCPMCGLLHVDQGDWAHKIPHRKHQCAGCHHIWQPYAVGTVGVDFHALCREQLDLTKQVMDSHINSLTKQRDELEARRDKHLALIAKLSQMVPLESEVGEALRQRGVLLAEIGTLRSQLAETEPLFQQALDEHKLLDDLLEGLGKHLPPGTPRTVKDIVEAVEWMGAVNKALSDRHEELARENATLQDQLDDKDPTRL